MSYKNTHQLALRVIEKFPRYCTFIFNMHKGKQDEHCTFARDNSFIRTKAQLQPHKYCLRDSRHHCAQGDCHVSPLLKGVSKMQWAQEEKCPQEETQRASRRGQQEHAIQCYILSLKLLISLIWFAWSFSYICNSRSTPAAAACWVSL